MKKLKSTLLPTLVALAMALAGNCVQAAGFQRGFAADPDGKPLEIGIWYPSQAIPTTVAVGPTSMAVALNGTVQGTALPLVVMSHGTGGMFMSHFDTAIALADAGYVVAAVTHTGDNPADQSRSLFVMDRPGHIRRVIDHMLSTWEGHGAIDPARVGMFGFSAGGFTTLASIGGVADFTRVPPVCREHPGDFACMLAARSGQTPAVPPASSFVAERRIKAAVVVAPALGFTFAPDGLKNAEVPVQLWRAGDDVVLPHPRYAEAVRSALPRAPDYREVPGAGHFDFLAPCSSALAQRAPAICTSGPDFDRAAFHQSFNAAVVGFFDRTLKAR